jgi:hypothetical protein
MRFASTAKAPSAMPRSAKRWCTPPTAS